MTNQENDDASAFGDFPEDLPENQLFATPECGYCQPGAACSIFSHLTAREREMMELRFGLVDGRNHTLEEIGRQFELPLEKVREIEAGVLRPPSRMKELEDFLKANED